MKLCEELCLKEKLHLWIVFNLIWDQLWRRGGVWGTRGEGRHRNPEEGSEWEAERHARMGEGRSEMQRWWRKVEIAEENYSKLTEMGDLEQGAAPMQDSRPRPRGQDFLFMPAWWQRTIFTIINGLEHLLGKNKQVWRIDVKTFPQNGNMNLISTA